MALRDDLLPIVDDARAIAGELGFRRYQVWVRTTTWSGSRVGLGTKTVTDTRLRVGGQDPKVREVTSGDVVAGTPELAFVEFEIGPLTPQFPGGGVSENTVNPPKGVSPSTVVFVVKGPGLPADGLICQRIDGDSDRPMRMMLRVRGSGRANTP